MTAAQIAESTTSIYLRAAEKHNAGEFARRAAIVGQAVRVLLGRPHLCARSTWRRNACSRIIWQGPRARRRSLSASSMTRVRARSREKELLLDLQRRGLATGWGASAFMLLKIELKVQISPRSSSRTNLRV